MWRNPSGSAISVNGTGWVLTAPDGARQTYDAYGRPLTVVDERGIGLTYSYDSNNRLARVTHTSGRSIGFAWSGAKVVSITAPNNKVYQYA